MPDWLLSRPTVIALAIAGGACSLLVSWCQSGGRLSPRQLSWLSRASYGFMAASIVLFITAGFFGSEQ
jgi:membrane protein required for beta-lactamase induction